MFDTDKERKSAIDDFKNLLTQPGWGLVVRIAEANIDVLSKRVIQNPHNQNKEELDVYRKKIEAYRDVVDTPENMIEKLSGGSIENKPQFDPYFTREELETAEEKAGKK